MCPVCSIAWLRGVHVPLHQLVRLWALMLAQRCSQVCVLWIQLFSGQHRKKASWKTQRVQRCLPTACSGFRLWKSSHLIRSVVLSVPVLQTGSTACPSLVALVPAVPHQGLACSGARLRKWWPASEQGMLLPCCLLPAPPEFAVCWSHFTGSERPSVQHRAAAQSMQAGGVELQQPHGAGLVRYSVLLCLRSSHKIFRAKASWKCAVEP